MKLLIDTNVLIPAEPASAQDVSPLTSAALRLQALAQQARVSLLIHPAQRRDIEGDKDAARRTLRLELLGRYPLLIGPPPVQMELQALVGIADPGSHDEVDDALLATVFGHAADYLVTEDRGVHRKARRASIADRIVFLSDAISILENLFERTPRAPPSVQALLAHQLDDRDPIFDSFRSDYPGFDPWLRKCKLEGRKCWVIPGSAGYAAVAIVNQETKPPSALTGKVMKICTLKVSDFAYGLRYGELLLKALFEFAYANGYGHAFLTAFEKHEELLQLLAAFGFEPLAGTTDLGELVLAKPLKPEPSSGLRGLDFNVRYGPRNVDWEQATYVIPIQPRYHEMLFPEQAPTLFSPQPFGNALRKAYLCNSQLRRLSDGSVVWFYRSRLDRGVVACGVAEGWLRSRSADVIARFVGRRTVYSFAQIQEMARREVLAILFRQALLLPSPVRLQEMLDEGVLNGPPQSIVGLGKKEASWLASKIRSMC